MNTRGAALRKLPRWLAAIAFALAGGSMPAAEDEPDVLDLAPGVSTTIVLDQAIGTAFIADPETADVNVLNERTLFVLGQAPGITTLRIHDKAGGLLAHYAVRVQLQTGYADIVVERVAGKGSGIEVVPVGDALFVSGEADSPAQAERLLRGIRAVAGEAPVVDALTLRTPAQVNLDVLISEVSRSVTRELGIDWSLDINPFLHPLRTWATGTGLRLGTGAMQLANIYDQVITFAGGAIQNEAGDAPTATNDISELGVLEPQRQAGGGVVLAQRREINSGKYRATAFLEALAENGLAVMHARPTLTTVSGEPAEFFSGLEIPVPTISEGIVGTEYRETGVSLAFTPTVLSDRQISLSVEPRIREIAAGGASIAGTIVPNINERSASTTVELADGESIAIAGLYRRSSGSSEAGIPLLKDIPVWGALFRTERDTDRSVELVIVVTPRIVAAVSESARASTSTPTESSPLEREQFQF